MTSQTESAPRAALADVVSDEPTDPGQGLDRVGMDGVETLVRWRDIEGRDYPLPARAALWVNLRGDGGRGIHMSRLYRALDAASLRPLSPEALLQLLDEMLGSHADLSDAAEVGYRFVLPLRRAALRSGLSGWRQYPVRILARRDANGTRLETGLEVPYSSTCPGSAALARQLVQEAFGQRFGSGEVSIELAREWLGRAEGVPATPHAQRSLARLRLRWQSTPARFGLEALVDAVEAALGTPVQAAVRREDEQEFARLNARHAMYCEDAARRLRGALNAWPELEDWSIRVAHMESLHPHDAVAVAVRGIEGGLRPEDA